MAANVLFLLAVRRGLLSIVVVVAALYPVSTVVLAFVLDRERVSRSQTIGMAMGLGALILVSISGAT
jgi:drug/metabolite transporter (DMT)-like permease